VLLVIALAQGFLGPVAGLLLMLGTGTWAAGLFYTGSVEAACYVPVVVGLFLASWSCGFLRELFVPMKRVDGK
jgi:hypothetical protein